MRYVQNLADLVCILEGRKTSARAKKRVLNWLKKKAIPFIRAQIKSRPKARVRGPRGFGLETVD